MQVTQTLAEGLKREFKVVVPAGDLAARAEAQLQDLKTKVRINGFRPGKVPVEHLRRLYGRSVLADVVNNVVGEANRRIVEENDIRLAMEPKLDFGDEGENVTKAIEGGGDLAYNVAVEVLPKFEVGDLSGIELERPVAEVPDADVQERLEDLARRNLTYNDADAGTQAASGNRVIVDFVGKIDGVPFDGGTGSDIAVDLGSGTFIPGFEDQLVGVKAGDEELITVTFPENYGSEALAGKEATFDVTVKSVQLPGELVVDDELAKSVGFETLDELKNAIRERLQTDFTEMSRRKLKRQLLDELDKRYTFDLPPTLLDQEFQNIWREVESEMKTAGKTFEDENTTEEKAREDYQRIAARRVRLGLVLAEIGESNKTVVTDEEMSRALWERARQFPGQERQIWDMFQKNPQMVAQLRAPLFEDKVVDHIVGLSKVTDKTVSKDELVKFDEDEDGAAS